MGERDKPVVSADGRLLGYIRPHPAMGERQRYALCSEHEPYVLSDGRAMATCRCRPIEKTDERERADG